MGVALPPQLGRLAVRARPARTGMKSITECVYRAEFDMGTYGRADEASRSRAWRRGCEPRCAARATGD